MADPFATALDAIFAGPLATACRYARKGGPSLDGVKVLLKETGESFAPFGAASVPATARLAEIRTAELDQAQKGDRLTIDRGAAPAETYTVASARKDRDGRLWKLELE